MSKTIRVADETYELLVRLKDEEESYDDVIERLLSLRREEVADGAGLWAGTDAAEEARAARRSMKEDVGK